MRDPLTPTSLAPPRIDVVVSTPDPVTVVLAHRDGSGTLGADGHPVEEERTEPRGAHRSYRIGVRWGVRRTGESSRRHACVRAEHPTYLAVDNTNVYWTNSGSPGVPSIMKVAISGGTPTTLAEVSGGPPQGVAVDPTSVYWTNTPVEGTGAVMKLALAGGTPTTLASGSLAPSGIAVDGTSVYWAAGDYADTVERGYVLRLSLDGGTPVTLASYSYPPWSDGSSIVVDATNAYWTTVSSVMKVPLAGGTPVTLASDPTMAPASVAVDDTSVYWSERTADQGPDGPPGTGAVMKVPIGGGEPMTLVSGSNQPGAIVVDNTSVYWTGSDGSVMKTPLAGGTSTTLVSDLVNMASIAVDSTSVYWVNYAADGGVMKITPK